MYIPGKSFKLYISSLLRGTMTTRSTYNTGGTVRPYGVRCAVVARGDGDDNDHSLQRNKRFPRSHRHTCRHHSRLLLVKSNPTASRSLVLIFFFPLENQDKAQGSQAGTLQRSLLLRHPQKLQLSARYFLKVSDLCR